MQYKVIKYISDIQEEFTGTCELCFGTAMVENGSITVEDENGKNYRNQPYLLGLGRLLHNLY